MALLKMSKEHDDIKLIDMDGLRGAQKRSDGKDGAGRAEGSHWSSLHQYDQHDEAHHRYKIQMDGEYTYAKRKDEYSRFDTYDGLALSEEFLGNYYSQKTGYVAKMQDTVDCLKVYDYEGQESCKGSFEDICSLMYEDDDLGFLDDLDLRFKTLAEICHGFTMESEVSMTTHVTSKPVPSTTHKDVNIQGAVSLQHSQKKGSSSTTIHTGGAQQSSSTSSTGMYVHEKVMVPNSTLLVQQPALYYSATTPVYVVEPQPTLLVTSGPVLGIQENLLVEEQKGSDAALQGTAKREMQHYQSVVLVEKQPTVQTQGRVSGALQIVNTEVRQSTESHEVKRAIHPVRKVMAGGSRERDVCGSLDMRVPQSL